jgi:hypothetical protein
MEDVPNVDSGISSTDSNLSLTPPDISNYPRDNQNWLGDYTLNDDPNRTLNPEATRFDPIWFPPPILYGTIGPDQSTPAQNPGPFHNYALDFYKQFNDFLESFGTPIQIRNKMEADVENPSESIPASPSSGPPPFPGPPPDVPLFWIPEWQRPPSAAEGAEHDLESGEAL